jgi:hypothetical protein
MRVFPQWGHVKSSVGIAPRIIGAKVSRIQKRTRPGVQIEVDHLDATAWLAVVAIRPTRMPKGCKTMGAIGLLFFIVALPVSLVRSRKKLATLLIGLATLVASAVLFGGQPY